MITRFDVCTFFGQLLLVRMWYWSRIYTFHWNRVFFVLFLQLLLRFDVIPKYFFNLPRMQCGVWVQKAIVEAVKCARRLWKNGGGTQCRKPRRLSGDSMECSKGGWCLGWKSQSFKDNSETPTWSSRWRRWRLRTLEGNCWRSRRVRNRLQVWSIMVFPKFWRISDLPGEVIKNTEA
jgi:hypothetical protein